MALLILVACRSIYCRVSSFEPALSISAFEKGTSSTEVNSGLAEAWSQKAQLQRQKEGRPQKRGGFHQQVSSTPRSYVQEHSTQQCIRKY